MTANGQMQPEDERKQTSTSDGGKAPSARTLQEEGKPACRQTSDAVAKMRERLSDGILVMTCDDDSSGAGVACAKRTAMSCTPRAPDLPRR